LLFLTLYKARYYDKFLGSRAQFLTAARLIKRKAAETPMFGIPAAKVRICRKINPLHACYM
jgi:hypothetical protein